MFPSTFEIADPLPSMEDPFDPSDPDAPRTINFKTLYWKCEDVESESGDVATLQIHIGGRTEPSEAFPEGQTVHCVVQNFTPYVYLELPKRIKWNKAKCIAVVDFFKKIMKTEGPIEYWLLQKYKLHHKKLCSTICLTFPTEKASKSLGSRCRNTRTGLVIDGVGTFKAGEFVVHETNVDPIIKFTASKRLKLASWVSVTETIRPEDEGMCVEDRKFTSADIDVYVDWLDVNPFTPEGTVIVKPKYMSFDIECNSKNHNSKLPDPEIPENCVFQISNTVGRFGDNPSLQKKTLFSLGNPHDIKGATVVRCLNEKDLFLRWRESVVRENPDVMVGYNTMKFDWNYMIVRAEKLGIYTKFAQISRIIGRRADLMKSAWSSSAYGEQNFRYLDPMGITNVDVLLEVERNYKLPKYTLDSVAEYFLKEHKDDITPRQLFMLFQLTMEMTPIVDALPRGVVPKETRVQIKKRIQDILPMRRCHGVVKELRTSLMAASRGIEFQNLVRDAFTLTGTYNIQDTVLPVAICEKLNLWTTMEETSNTMNIPVSYLHTRGQLIKVVAQIYRETIFNDLIIPFREKVKDGEGERFQGAVVIEANPGDYDNVVCFDFESLYPSTMIAFNICYTTLKEDDDPIPDSECHVIEFSDHVGCPHDPKHRKKKAADILCKEHRYRFKKVVYHPDGTREHEGLMPRLERNLLAERKLKKKELAKLEARYKMASGTAGADNIKFYKDMGWEIIEKGSLTEKQLEILKVGITVLNAQQNALKISANSMYGSYGAQNGPVPLIPGAASITGMGRMLIMEAIRYILAKYPGAQEVGKKGHAEGVKDETGKAKLVYGDSVVPDTPILIRQNGILRYVNIEDIPRKTPWANFVGEKEIALPEDNVEVWSDKGFTFIRKIIRHFTDKTIYRVTTGVGSVDCTEDHSLLSPNGKEIRPVDVKIGTELMHTDLPLSTLPFSTLHVKIKCKTKLEAANCFWRSNNIATLDDGLTINISDPSFVQKDSLVQNPNLITNIELLGPSTDYVYDLETENHHFAAGVGKMVVHNTDSSMITFVGKSTAESFELGDRISKEVSHYLKCYLLGFEENFEIECPSERKKYRVDKYPRDKINELSDDLKVCIYRYDGNPINLAFENLYKRYVLLTKKRYFAHAVNRKGEIIAVIKKGIVMARRDNSLYLRDTYGGMMNGILDRLSENEVMYILYDRIHKLFTRQIPDANLIVYTGIKTVVNYAKKKEKKQGRTVIERTFVDEDGEPIADPIGPLDPRLRYPNLPQVLLSLKMLRRGDDVPPNTRLEYLYLENENADHQGEKAEDYTFYKENKDILNLKPDFLHYIEKQLAKPVTELLGVKYPREKIPYEKIDDALERCIAGLDELIKHRVGQVKVYERSISEKHTKGEKYGWCAKWCPKCKASAPKRCFKHNPKTTCRTYTYKRKHAQVQYILDSAATKKANPKAANEIDERKYPELLKVCRLWKSRYILDALYKQHGVRKRPTKRPTQTGEKLRIKTNDGPVQVLLALPVGKYPKGTLVTLKAIQEGVLENSAKKKKFYTYTVETQDGVTLENVPRKSITTWRYKDGTLMKDVLLARGSYRCVVKHLDIEFCPLNFVGAPAKKVEIFEMAEDNSE